MQTNTIHQGDALELARQLDDNSIHCIVTSPPYWSLRDYQVPGQLGLEPTPEEYIAKMVQLFGELRRALHPSGTLWLNMGDSYARQAGDDSKKYTDSGLKTGRSGKNEQLYKTGNNVPPSGLKPKDLVGIPWRLALALQADGWYLRSDIIWAKPNPMPESVTDRPTKAHEYIFLLTKSARYYYDAEAVREKGQGTWNDGGYRNGANDEYTTGGNPRKSEQINGRNRRTVWTVATQPYAEAHFATFPPKLIEPCVLAGTSAKGVCPECGAPWERVVEKTDEIDERAKGSKFDHGKTGVNGQGRVQAGERYLTTTICWRPTCDHDHDPVPATVLDPFMGSGTTAQVAIKHHRAWMGFELSADYIALAEKRISGVQMTLFA